MEKIGDKLYSIRIEHNISQEQLGAKIGVARQTISLWEANRRQISSDKLMLICKEFDVSPEYFLSNQKDENIVCAELNQESQDEITCVETSSQEEKKKLSKMNKVLIAIIVVAIIIGVVASVVIKMYSFNDVDGYQTASVTMYNFDDLFWLIPGFAGLVVVIVVTILIKVNLERKG